MPFHARRSVVLQRLAVLTLMGVVLSLSDIRHPADYSGTPLLRSADAKAPASLRQRTHTRFTPAYAYRDRTFSGFVADSYRQTPPVKTDASEFYHWLDTAYARTRRTVGPPPGIVSSLPLAAALDAERARLSRIHGSTAKSRQERQVASWAHRTVKKAVPRFSLERGFEFYNMVHGGERQCYSQSVLIAGMLQRAGIPAGVVMVWKSRNGLTSNNGHAVVVAQLSNGRHLLVDASEPLPFPRQQGLFLRESGRYRYVTPLFAGNGVEIVGYRRNADSGRIATSSVQTLDLPFLKSQFYYYRGERTPGGAFAPKKTTAGLSRSAQYLQTSVQLCPENSLAVYMLGRVYQRQGKTELAREQFAQSYRQYSRNGYFPEGARDAFALVGGKMPQITKTDRKAINALADEKRRPGS